jgi:uncharacterized protein (TIGR03435 family)
MNIRGLPGKLVLVGIGGCLLLVLRPSFVRAQSASGDQPKFEVASVKSCESGDLPPAPPPPADGGRGVVAVNPVQWSPGRLTVTCRPVRAFITWAYGDYADGQSHPDRLGGDISSFNAPIEGLPSWASSERFTVSAEVPGDASKELMMGPMMQSLLEDRFNLKIHTETRDVPAYDLTVAKGGPKLPQADETVCRAPDPDHPGQRLGPASLPNCNINAESVNMANFANLLRLAVDRPIVDKTGLEGTFAIHMVFSPDLPGDSDLPTILDAMKEQLGLELVPAKGKVKALVVDHIEEPTPN